MRASKQKSLEQKGQRLGEIKYNNQNCQMKIAEYNNSNNIIVEFQDEHKWKVHTDYRHFKNGNVKNPYNPSLYGAGIVGAKYPMYLNNKHTKEYKTWNHIIERCFSEEYHNRYPTYKNATCCNEWLLFENFYDWLHKQENFDKWYNGDKWHLDKDIFVKKNKVYSPNTCCLVPENINLLFTKRDRFRGNFPIGVTKNWDGFLARCCNPITNIRENIGTFSTPEKAFYAYKQYKENLIKQIAKIEYNAGNITKECYDAMMNYEVEITD